MPIPDRRSVLVVHHRDLSTPIGTTLAYYVADRLSTDHDVHVVCRKRRREHSGDHDQRATLHHIDTGEVPVVSTILYHAFAALAVVVLGLRTRYDVVYGFQSSILQGRLGALAAGGRAAVTLSSVPVRQREDMSAQAGTPAPRERVALALLSAYGAVVGRLLATSDVVTCLTAGIRDVTEATYGIDLSDAHVLGMGVDVAAFAPPESVTGGSEDGDLHAAADAGGEGRSWRGGDGPTLTYIGNVSETRNLDVVVEALADLDESVTFQLAGQGPDADVRGLLRRAEERGLADRLDWLGLVPHRDIPELLARSDVTLSPLPDIESYRVSFPAKLLEYLAAGTQVVATDIHPHRMLLADGENGYLYDGTRAELVATIDRALGDEARDAVVRRARATAVAFDWDVVVEGYEAALFDAGGDTPGVDLRSGRRSRAETVGR